MSSLRCYPAGKLGSESIRNLPEPQHLILDIRGESLNRNCVGQNLSSAFSRTSVPRAVPLTEERTLISKEKNPDCGEGHEKVTAVSSSPAAHRLRTSKHTVKERKKVKRNDMDSEKPQLGFTSSNRKKREKKFTFFAKYIAGCKQFMPALHIYILEGFS